MPTAAAPNVAHRPLLPGAARPAAPDRARARSVVHVAAFASAATRQLGRDLGFEVAVISVVVDPEAHARSLSRRWHAAWTVREHWFQPFDDVWAGPSSVEFSVKRVDPRWMGRSVLPRGVEVDHGALRLELPQGRRREFADVFASAMIDRRFDQVASRPSQVRRRYATGRSLAVLPRYAGDPSLGVTGPWFTLVDDLYRFRPRDLPVIADAAAKAAAVVALRATLAAGTPGAGSCDA